MGAVDPAPRGGRAPAFTIASWLVPVGGMMLTALVYSSAVAMRRPGEWLPGVGAALAGCFLTGIGTFICGLVAILRRERRAWLAVIPLLAGFATVFYFAWCTFMR